MRYNEIAYRINLAKSRGHSIAFVYNSETDIKRVIELAGPDYQYRPFPVSGVLFQEISWTPGNLDLVPVEPTDLILHHIRDVLSKSGMQLGACWNPEQESIHIHLVNGELLTATQIYRLWGCTDWPYLQSRLREQPHISFQVVREDFE